MISKSFPVFTLWDLLKPPEKKYCNIEVAKFLKSYHIKQALPDLDYLQYEISPTETQLKPNIFLAGDHLGISLISRMLKSLQSIDESVRIKNFLRRFKNICFH